MPPQARVAWLALGRAQSGAVQQYYTSQRSDAQDTWARRQSQVGRPWVSVFIGSCVVGRSTGNVVHNGQFYMVLGVVEKSALQLYKGGEQVA